MPGFTAENVEKLAQEFGEPEEVVTAVLVIVDNISVARRAIELGQRYGRDPVDLIGDALWCFKTILTAIRPGIESFEAAVDKLDERRRKVLDLQKQRSGP